MNTDAYMAFLAIGGVLVAIDGQLIYRSGRRYMQKSNAESGTSMVKLVTVLFHLTMLGLLALLSTVDFGMDYALTHIVSKVGALLLVLAIGHGVAMAIIAHTRDEQVAESMIQDGSPSVGPSPRHPHEPAVTPPADQGRNPTDYGRGPQYPT